MIEKMSSLVTSKCHKTNYRLWINGKVEVLFHQSNKLWIVTYTSKPIYKRRFRSLDELKAEFTKIFGANND